MLIFIDITYTLVTILVYQILPKEVINSLVKKVGPHGAAPIRPSQPKHLVLRLLLYKIAQAVIIKIDLPLWH